jgi:hypothetical protein
MVGRNRSSGELLAARNGLNSRICARASAVLVVSARLGAWNEVPQSPRIVRSSIGL